MLDAAAGAGAAPGTRGWALGLRRRLRAIAPADLLAIAGFALIAILYFWRLDAFLINDDEGSYLYAAWRISRGELPYRDFLTPQLPLFLLPGGLLMRLFGPEVWPARALAAGMTLATGALLWLAVRRLYGPAVALLAGAVFLLHPDVYLHGRTFRSDPFMLCLATLGLLFFLRAVFPRPGAADPPERPWLAASGVAFGLATLAKLFGPLPMLACLAWLALDGRARGRPRGAIARDGLLMLLACGLTVVLGIGAFFLLSDQVYAAVLEHHLRQGGDKAAGRVLGDGLAFFALYLRQGTNALLLLVGLAAGVSAWRRRDRASLVFALVLPTALVFLFLGREKYPRHLVYLLPALALLFAQELMALAGSGGSGPGAPADWPGRRARWLAGALVAALLLPWALLDRDHGFRWETGTARLADLVTLLTRPDEPLFSDYSELNFYARRPTTYAGASLSAGATASGQITWERLAGELGERLPPLLLLDSSAEFGHLRFLRDRPAFEAWLAEHYGPPAGLLQRDHQRYEVYAPRDRPLPRRARFEGGPDLLAAAPERAEARPGEAVDLLSAWQAPGALAEDLALTARLVDAAGLEWAQADGTLLASDAGSDQRVRGTSAWLPGEIAAERLALSIPPGTPPGDYDLLLGLYRSEGGDALTVVDAEGRPLGASVPAGRLTVLPDRSAAAELPAAALDLDLRGSGERLHDAELLGRGPLPEQVQAGTILPLDLWWSLPPGAGGGPARLWLGEPGSGAVAADWEILLPQGPEAGDGAAGSGEAAAGEGPAIVRQRVFVPVSARAGAGDYRLGLAAVDEVDPAGGGAQPSSGGGSGEADSEAESGTGPAAVDLGRVRVLPRDLGNLRFEAPAVAHPVELAVGTLGSLIGWDGPRGAAPGDSVALDLVWRAQAPAPIDYQVTVQLLDAEGHPRAQHDGMPAEGERPSSGWVPEEVIVDRHRLAIPADLAPGRYSLVAAVYHPLTGARLPVAGRADGTIPLGSLAVEP